MFAEGELTRLTLYFGGALLVFALLMLYARRRIARGKRAMTERLERVVERLATGGTGYRSAAARSLGSVEAPRLETRETGPALRFGYRDQRAMLDLYTPRLTYAERMAPEVFGGLRCDLPLTRLRFWLAPPAARKICWPLDEPPAEREETLSAVGSAVHQRLAALGSGEVGFAIGGDGLFVTKLGWGYDDDALLQMIEASCEVVDAHLDGTLWRS